MTRPESAPSPAPPDASEAEVVDLSVVIVNYNVRAFLEQALHSVRRAARRIEAEVFVVDNDSVDGSCEMVREQFPEVTLIANEENVGFGRANNQAIREARGRHLLILNPDTIVREDTFEVLVRFMDHHPEAGAAGCAILNPDGTFAPESRRAFPTPAVAFYRMIGLSRLFPSSPRFARYNMGHLPEDEVAEVDALSGSCMCVRRAALYEPADSSGDGRPAQGAGLFDESFFMYGEDLDWCYRIQQAGWKIYYTPETQIVHYKGESTKKGDMRYVRRFYGAMLQFSEKHLEEEHSPFFAGLLRGGIYAKAAISVAGQWADRLREPALDGLSAALVIAFAGWAYTQSAGVEVTSRFFLTVVPLFALCVVLGIALTGGYRSERTAQLRPVFWGVPLGLAATAAVSFFARSIAYSRVALLISAAGTLLLLAGRRLLRRWRPHAPRRALLVGFPEEADRLQAMLQRHPQPPLELVGFVPPEPADALEDARQLGALRQLRDLVRLREIEDVVFAAEEVSNQQVFSLIERLRDLPIHFRILAAGQSHLIGKASIEDLQLPALLEAESALGLPRRSPAHRAWEIAVALVGLLARPLLWPLQKHSRRARRLASRLRHLPAVLRGRRSLVGFDPSTDPAPPESWPLKPGVVSLTEMRPPGELDAEEARALYWYYLTHRSPSLDAYYLATVLRKLRR